MTGGFLRGVKSGEVEGDDLVADGDEVPHVRGQSESKYGELMSFKGEPERATWGVVHKCTIFLRRLDGEVTRSEHERQI